MARTAYSIFTQASQRLTPGGKQYSSKASVLQPARGGRGSTELAAPSYDLASQTYTYSGLELECTVPGKFKVQLFVVGRGSAITGTGTIDCAEVDTSSAWYKVRKFLLQIALLYALLVAFWGNSTGNVGRRLRWGLIPLSLVWLGAGAVVVWEFDLLDENGATWAALWWVALSVAGLAYGFELLTLLTTPVHKQLRKWSLATHEDQRRTAGFEYTRCALRSLFEDLDEVDKIKQGVSEKLAAWRKLQADKEELRRSKQECKRTRKEAIARRIGLGRLVSSSSSDSARDNAVSVNVVLDNPMGASSSFKDRREGRPSLVEMSPPTAKMKEAGSTGKDIPRQQQQRRNHRESVQQQIRTAQANVLDDAWRVVRERRERRESWMHQAKATFGLVDDGEAFFFPQRLIVAVAVGMLVEVLAIRSFASSVDSINTSIRKLSVTLTDSTFTALTQLETVYFSSFGEDLPMVKELSFFATSTEGYDLTTTLADAIWAAFIAGMVLGTFCYLCSVVASLVSFRSQALLMRQGRTIVAKKVTLLHATYFIGAYVANGLVVWYLVTLVIMLVLVPLLWRLSRELIWYGFKQYYVTLIVLITPMLVNMVLNTLIKKYALRRGQVHRAATFAQFDMWMAFLQVVASVVTGIVRVAMVLVAALIALFRTDVSPMPAWIDTNLAALAS